MKYEFIVGGPADAQAVGYAQVMVERSQIRWHSLPRGQKVSLFWQYGSPYIIHKDMWVADSFVEAIAQALLTRKWCSCQRPTVVADTKDESADDKKKKEKKEKKNKKSTRKGEKEEDTKKAKEKTGKVKEKN